jgi:hypothetical protein
VERTPAFFEAFFTNQTPAQPAGVWHDVSSDTFYIFESPFGTVRLRKRHSFPATFAFTTGTTLHFGYGDVAHGQTVATSDLAAYEDRALGDEEFLYASADLLDRRVIVQRDAMCVLPVFAAYTPQGLALSNHSEKLPSFFSKDQLQINTSALINYLVFDDRYHHTIANIEPLHDRVRLEWQSGKHRILYPQDSFIVHAKQGGGELIGFKEVLEETFDTYWNRYQKIGFQLSGGLDSATAPGYYASHGKEVITATLGLPGVMGARQQEKIDAMVKRFGLKNHMVVLDPKRHFPLVDIVTGNHEGMLYEYSELLAAPIRELADYYAEQGIETVFTGVGGDELCQNIPNDQILPEGSGVRRKRLETQLPHYFTDAFRELHSAAQTNASDQPSRPLPSIAYSVMLTNLGFNNTFIDRNVWPVAPLSDPKLFFYSQSIPAWHRYDKNLLRMYQFARGFPESIVHPETLEDFSEFIHLCKPHMLPLFEAFFATSALASRRLLDAPAFSQHREEVLRAPFDPSDTRILALIRLLVSEVNLHRI